MWSLGVIAAEIYLGKLPFYGETSTDQLAAIMEVVGLVPPQMIYSSPRMHVYQSEINILLFSSDNLKSFIKSYK